MRPLSVYVETTVWSCAFADEVPESRKHTLAFFDACRVGSLQPYISAIVIDEIENADPETRKKLVSLIQEINPKVVPETVESMKLADAFLRARVVPKSKPIDARHVAIAFNAGLDVLVSWNFRHITSVRRSERFNAAAIMEGFYKPLRIAAPPELMYDDQLEPD